jgi:hypothetical protein
MVPLCRDVSGQVRRIHTTLILFVSSAHWGSLSCRLILQWQTAGPGKTLQTISFRHLKEKEGVYQPFPRLYPGATNPAAPSLKIPSLPLVQAENLTST